MLLFLFCFANIAYFPRDPMLAPRLSNHVGVEGVWGGGDVEVLVVHLDSQDSADISEVAGGDDELLAVAEDNDGSAAKVATGVGYHLGARHYELAEMFISVVFGGIALLARLAVDLNEGVLRPPPGGLSVVRQDEIPVVVLVAPVAEVVAEQEKGVLTSLPVHRAVAALALAHHQTHLGIALFELGEVLAAFPLSGDSLDVGLQRGIVDNPLDIVQTVGVEGAYPQFHLRVLLPQCRSQIFVVET